MNNKVMLEVLWWVATAIIAMLFLLPIYLAVGMEYPFYPSNIGLIVVFITLTRYIFLLKHTWLAKLKWVKAALVFLPIPLFFWATDALYNFQDYADKQGFVEMLYHLSPDDGLDLGRYMRYQYLFFGTGVMITLALFPIRLVISLWRGVNKGTV